MRTVLLAFLMLAAEEFPALFNLGYSYFREQRFAEAAPLLRRAAEASPNDFNAHYLLGVTLLKLNQSDDAPASLARSAAYPASNLRLMQVMSIEYSKGRYFGDSRGARQACPRFEKRRPNLYFTSP